MKKRYYPLLFILTLFVSGCATEAWSYLHAQEPSIQQGHELITTISDHLVREFGFTKLASKAHGNDVYEKEFTVGRVSISLKEGKYPLIYVQIPRAQVDAAEIQSIFRMIEASYATVGLAIPRPAKETWAGI